MEDRQYMKLQELKQKIVGNCSVCKGVGTITVRKFIKQCSCLKKFLKIKELVIANIPEAYWNLKLRDFVEQKGGNSIQVYWKMRKYLKHLGKARQMGLGILFAGTEGSGKTFLACCILKKALELGFTAKYLRFEDYLFLVKSTPLEELSEIKQELKEVDFLVLDDIGREYHKVGSTFGISELIGLYKVRESENRPTVLSTSLTKKEFLFVYGKASSILLEGSLKPIEVLRPNFKKEILNKKWESLKK